MANDIVIRQQTQRITVKNVGPQGVRGPEGPPGQSGEGAVFEFQQVLPSSSWVINHDLGVEPLYNVIEAVTGDVLEPAPIHHSPNQLELQFLTPRAGVARLRS